MPADRWLVAGLGNPGAKYADTRHNVGRDAARALAERHGASWSSNRRVRCEVAQVRLQGGGRLTLLTPQAAMNRSGGPLQQAVHWFDVPVEQLVVIHDDLDLELGAIKLKQGGGHGGHNGLRDLDGALSSRDYLRVRVGIGRPPPHQPARDYVLAPFRSGERETADRVIEDAGAAVQVLVTDGLEPAQNRFHGAQEPDEA